MASKTLALIFPILLIVLAPPPAQAWDSATHRLITRLAINALPDSPLKIALRANELLVEQHSVEPDSILKDRYGRREEIRHYIDIEIYQRDIADPFATLDPDFATMRRRVGEVTLEESGTLPWTIEETARHFAAAWRKGNCSEMLRQAGYLSHYVGDASQPLHSTIHFDGYRRDKGIHARIENGVDDRTSMLEAQASPEVKMEEISSVWPIEISEIRDANALVQQTIDADRHARKTARKGPAYTNALFSEAAPMFTHQIARAASVLASIWLYEWKSAGSPDICGQR